MTLRQRQPRVRDKKYLAYIADLGGPHGFGCLICRTQPCEVCHVRYAERCEDCGAAQLETIGWVKCSCCNGTGYRFGKLPTGMGSKSDDKWTVPLCPDCHRLGKDAQHSMSERVFWEQQDIDVLALCRALQAAYEMSDRLQAGIFVLENSREAA